MSTSVIKEPIGKRVLIISLACAIIMFCFQGFFFYRLTEKIQSNEVQTYERVTGTMLKVCPDKKEEIGQAIFMKNNKEALSEGKNMLEQYGYSTNMKIFDNKLSKWHYKDFLIEVIVINLLTFSVFIILIIWGYKGFLKRAGIIAKGMESFIEGDYHIKLKDDKEGILCRLGHNFNVMSNRIKITIEQLNNEKEKVKEFVNNISHQLKTPLSSLELFNSLLLEGDLEEKERIEFLKRSEIEITNLQWMASNLVKVARLETDMIQINTAFSDIKNTVIEAINGIYAKARDKGIQINIQELVGFKINHDARWTKEALGNILENSLKYTEAGGKINISMEKNEVSIKIIIEDSGVGIEKEELSKIFNRFYRGKSQLIQSSEGSGIGLYLAKWIIEEQGGTIRVKSTPGKGSAFSVIIFT